jgi:hypothetical protein
MLELPALLAAVSNACDFMLSGPAATRSKSTRQIRVPIKHLTLLLLVVKRFKQTTSLLNHSHHSSGWRSLLEALHLLSIETLKVRPARD